MAKSKSTKSKAPTAKIACRRHAETLLTKDEVLREAATASLWDYACRILHDVMRLKAAPA